MKKLAWVLLALPFMAFHCKKDDSGRYVKGRVIRISCASYIIEVLNDNSIGQDNWKDMMDNNKEYDNAINASNKCEIPDFIVKGNIIRFKITGEETHPCAICFMYDGPPNVAYVVKDVSLVSAH